MTPAPRRRLGRDGMLIAVMLSVPVLVLLGFRVAAAPADPPPVEERPLQLTTDGTSSTPTPSSTSASTRPTWTPTPSWTSRTDGPAPTYDDDDAGDDDGAADDEYDDD